jgi:hypothetical protein
MHEWPEDRHDLCALGSHRLDLGQLPLDVRQGRVPVCAPGMGASIASIWFDLPFIHEKPGSPPIALYRVTLPSHQLDLGQLPLDVRQGGAPGLEVGAALGAAGVLLHESLGGALAHGVQAAAGRGGRRVGMLCLISVTRNIIRYSDLGVSDGTFQGVADGLTI